MLPTRSCGIDTAKSNIESCGLPLFCMSRRPPIKVYEEVDHPRLVLKHHTVFSLRHLTIITGREGAICAPPRCCFLGGANRLDYSPNTSRCRPTTPRCFLTPRKIG